MNKITQILEVPWIAHLIRTVARFSVRLGSAFAAAITYYAILASVPILLFAFSMLGMFMTVLRPDLLAVVEQNIRVSLHGSGVTDKVMSVIDSSLHDWRASMLVGIFTVFLSGTSLISTMKTAVYAQLKESFDPDKLEGVWWLDMIKNFGILIVFLVLFGAMGVATSVGNSAVGLIHSFIDFPGSVFMVRVVPLLISILMGWLMYWSMLTLFIGKKTFNKKFMQGSFLGGALLAVVLYFAGYIIGRFSSNVTAAIFGPIITIMLLLNVFGQLILFVAAWVATYDPPVENEISADEKTVALDSQVEINKIPTKSSGELSKAATGFAAGLGAAFGMYLAGRKKRKRKLQEAIDAAVAAEQKAKSAKS